MVRILGRKRHKGEIIASRYPVGKFRVEKVLKVAFREVLVGKSSKGLYIPATSSRGRALGSSGLLNESTEKLTLPLLETKLPL